MPRNWDTPVEPVFPQRIPIRKKIEHYKPREIVVGANTGATLAATDEKLLLGITEPRNNWYWFGSQIHILSSKDGEAFQFLHPRDLLPTSTAPSLTAFQDQFVIAFTRTRSTDYPHVVPPEESPGPGPFSVEDEERYEGNITVSKSYHGSFWEDTIQLGYKTRSSPNIISIDSPLTLVLNWRRARADELYVRFSDGHRWFGDHQVAHHKTSSGPAIGFINNQLVTAFKGKTNSYIHTCVNSISSAWPNSIRLPDITDSKPSLQYHNGQLYLAWTEEGRISLRRSSDGLRWSRKFITDATAIGFPDLASFKGELYCCWLDAATRNVYTGTIPLG